MEKKRKKKSQIKNDKSPAKNPEVGHVEADKNPDPFDFGGLPNRDLKKNLGCG